jgi:hypothetical protein
MKSAERAVPWAFARLARLGRICRLVHLLRHTTIHLGHIGGLRLLRSVRVSVTGLGESLVEAEADYAVGGPLAGKRSAPSSVCRRARRTGPNRTATHHFEQVL